MILTFKIRHGRDFSDELLKARKVAEFSIRHRKSTSADVRHVGLKSVISNQILRKYGRNKKIKKVSQVNLIVPSQGVKVNQDDSTLYISCLKLHLSYRFRSFSKVNQIEISKDYAFVSVTIPEEPETRPATWLGMDMNATGHCCVVSCSATGKVLKLGKKAHHVHTKYKNQRRRLQKKRKLRLLKRIKRRESRIVRDLNHKISRKVVNYARENNAGIVLEDLSGIRKTKKQAKSFRYALNSWSYYQLGKFIAYKAKLLGIPVVKIDPRYTSQQCSRCGLLGTRNKKQFKCLACRHVEDADVNASFVIGLRHQGILRSYVDRDAYEGSTGTPKEATARRMQTLEPLRL